MKKFLIATILILGLTTVPIYAQEDSNEVEIQIEDDQILDENRTEESTTLAEELRVEKTQNFTFLTILFAILTPALLVAVAYMLIKMSNK